MSVSAKVFKNGRSQAIRIPAEYRFSGSEVTLERVAGGILISERNPWDVAEEACAGMSDSLFSALDHRNEKLKLEERSWQASS